MDPTTYYQQLMTQALMGPLAQPGMQRSGESPITQQGQMGMTGNPTAPGGMLGTSPWAPYDPNAPAGPIPPSTDPMWGGPGQQNPQQPNPFQLQQAFQSYPLPEGHGSESGSGR